MRWMFDAGEWEAESLRRDEDDFELTWRIHVCEDGRFSLNASDDELPFDKNRIFGTLQAAKAYCESQEPIVADSGSKVINITEPIIDLPLKDRPMDGASAWFHKMALSSPTVTVGPPKEKGLEVKTVLSWQSGPTIIGFKNNWDEVGNANNSQSEV